MSLDPVSLRLPDSRRRCLISLVTALATGRLSLDAGSDWEETRRNLLTMPGVGPWTTEIVAMRALGDPDAFPVTDRGVQLGLAAVGLTTAANVRAHSARWRPWRAYATQYLWSLSNHAINQWPPKGSL